MLWLCYVWLCYNHTLSKSRLSTNPQYLKMWLHLEVGHLRRWLSKSAASIVAPNLISLVFLEEKKMWSHKKKHQGCMCTDKKEYEDIRKSGYLEVKEKCLRRNEPCVHLDLEHWENKFLIFKPPILYFFFFLFISSLESSYKLHGPHQNTTLKYRRTSRKWWLLVWVLKHKIRT